MTADSRPKHGVVSLLEPTPTERVRRIWGLLESEFGLRGVMVMPYPHFSYQIAAGYRRPDIEEGLERLSRRTTPFSVRTTGLGRFEGPWPVVFVAVEPSAELRSFHSTVWDECTPRADAPEEYYRPGAWVPHITLAHGEERNSQPLPEETVARIHGALATEDFRWELRVEDLTLVWDEGTVQRPVCSFRLRGP